MSQADVALQLRARTVALDEPVDLLDHLGPGGAAWIDGDHGFVTSGVAATVAPADAVAFLAEITHAADRNAPRPAGPRAIGALPFAGDGRLIVPACIVGREPDGGGWFTTIGTNAPAPALLHVATPTPTRFTVSSRTSEREWNDAVAQVLAAIAANIVEKVVLARVVDVEADLDFDVRAVLRRLLASQPGCITYADGGFVGASPELLVHRRGERVTCRPLAGTGLDAQQLAASKKDAWEHQLVVDAVTDALRTCSEIVLADRPAPVTFADVSHLATTVTASAPKATVIDLVRALHPTPAVAGTPTDRALALIDELEPTPRDRYAGPFGWVDGRGDGSFAVALRGAVIDGAHATLHAGAGIVRGSVADAERAETQAKFRPMLAALVAP